jgi:segregation and condensation protein B
MDDISREPGPETPRIRTIRTKGPVEIMRLAEATVDETELGVVDDDRERAAQRARQRPLRIAPVLGGDGSAAGSVAPARELPAARDRMTDPGAGAGETDDLEAAAAREDGVPEPTAAADEDSDAAPPLSEPADIARVALAVLLSTRESMTAARLGQICEAPTKAIEAGLERLADDLRAAGLPLEVERTGDSVRILTSAGVYPYLARSRKLKKADKLSPAALETLAVIAYRQPVIRAEIESIRGVKAGPMLRSLLDHKLVRITGRADVPGRPLQYGTTQQFLERFGLRSLKDLPSVQEFKSLG